MSVVIRVVYPFDLARYALFGSSRRSGHAWTLDSLSMDLQPRLSVVEAVRLSVLFQGRGVCSWTWTQRNRVVGIAAAKPRSGPRTWEITILLLASDDDRGCAGLLDRVCHDVARKGGEKVFIRLRRGDSVVEFARRCGFVPCSHELLYTGGQRAIHNGHPISMREKKPADDYSLFRLYNASTPFETRYAVGITFDQWSSSRERSRGRSREFLYGRDGLARGWVKTVRRTGAGQLMMIVHPESEMDTASMMGYGLAQLAGARTVYCLASEHQVHLQRLLWQRGYEVVSEFDTLVRSMTVLVGQEAVRKAVTISPT